MSESFGLPLPLEWDADLRRIEEKFSDVAMEAATAALIRDGANEAAASNAIKKVVRETARYLRFGSVKAAPDKQVKAELVALAKAFEVTTSKINGLSPGAHAALHVSLEPEVRLALFGPRRLRRGNPDPIYEAPAPSLGGLAALGGLFDRKIKQPADMSAKFDRVHFDLFQLAPLVRAAASKYRVRRGRPSNWPARMLFEVAILEWANASGQAPTSSQIDGVVASPLLSFLHALVYPVSEDQGLREALSDAVFLAVLANMKARRSGGLLDLRVVPGRRRNRRGSGDAEAHDSSSRR